MTYSKDGRLIVVVGASGAGKDSILKGAANYYHDNPRVEFVRRVITRECDPETEVHDSVTEEQFIVRQKHGDFSVWWQANGLYYGIPAEVLEKISLGQLIIANGSRAAIEDIRSTFKQLTIVHIAVTEEVLAGRLASRSRESDGQIKRRLQRNKMIKAIEGDDVVTIDNNLAKQSAIDEFIALIQSSLDEVAI